MCKRNKPQLNALVVNDLDKEMNEDLFNEMAIDECSPRILDSCLSMLWQELKLLIPSN